MAFGSCLTMTGADTTTDSFTFFVCLDICVDVMYLHGLQLHAT